MLSASSEPPGGVQRHHTFPRPPCCEGMAAADTSSRRLPTVYLSKIGAPVEAKTQLPDQGRRVPASFRFDAKVYRGERACQPSLCQQCPASAILGDLSALHRRRRLAVARWQRPSLAGPGWARPNLKSHVADCKPSIPLHLKLDATVQAMYNHHLVLYYSSIDG